MRVLCHRSACAEFCFWMTVLGAAGSAGVASAEPSVARQWNEQLLHAISIDTARPTVHARNLFHLSTAMYDAWVAYDVTAAPYLHHEKLPLVDVEAARNEAISYAAYNLIKHRFVTGPAGVGPGAAETLVDIDFQMSLLGYDPGFTSTVGDSPAALGNRVAQTVIQHGLADGANELNRYASPPSFNPVNPPLTFEHPGTVMNDPNRWQSLHFLGNRVDQFGRPINEATQRNLTPFWGEVTPFAMTPADRSSNGVYHDQGMPPGLNDRPDEARFKQDALVMIRLSSQLDPNDGVVIDVSPASRGNTPEAPFRASYEQTGHAENPYTGLPYQPQLARRGDFYRVISEYWADGPHSTAPPGHWNEIRNDVADTMEQLGIAKRIGGIGAVVNDLEWDVKSMFALNGGLHDAAIAAWNHKGIYDSSRPISFVRYMGGLGQSMDPDLKVDLGGGNIVSTYHPHGLPLEPGLVEVISPATTTAGERHEHLAGHEGRIAVRSWRGAIDGVAPFDDPADIGGVDWILAENWMPYQLISFVTPPFAGYVSGHSTYSRTAAEILTLLTGSPYFPGGLGEFVVERGSGLNFEYGPREQLTLQWATYFDASDQASLSRLTGGIHPPADDFPGRRIGTLVGPAAWEQAVRFFTGQVVPEPTSATLALLAILLIGARRTQGRRGRPIGIRAAGPVVRFRAVSHVGCSIPIISCSILGMVGCARVATAGPTFTNVTAALGINHVQSMQFGQQTMTGGAVAADFDGDGLVDLFFTRVGGPDVLYRNTGSGFEDVSAWAGFTVALPTNGAAAGDIDNDGDIDLYVMGSESTRHFLYINDGTGRFTEEAVARGAAVAMEAGSPNRRGQGVAFGDYDGDGYLDMLTSEHSRPMTTSGSRLLRNLGAANPGHFEDVTHAAGLDVYRTPLAVTNPPNAYRFVPQFTDLDRDGRPDIVIAADSRTSQLFWNNGDGTFTDGTLAAGVGTDKSGMGSALGDFDRDGNIDWFVTAIYDTTFLGTNPGNRLYRNNGDRTFTDVTTAAGVRNTGPGLSWGWGTTFFDFDNDAHLDLIATNGFVSGYGSDRTTLWRNNADGTFTDVSVASAITDTGQGRGLLHLDYDGDGDLDIVVVNYAAAPILYRNDGGNEANWLRVKTEGTHSNLDGIGAFIKVVPDLGQPYQFQVWEVTSGGSYLSQSELTAHFGLGDWVGSVDLVEVEWPTSGLVQRFVDVPVNSQLTAREGLLGDYNGDSVVDAADYVVWRDTLGMTGAGLAADGAGVLGLPDGVVDQLDYQYWKANFGLTFAGKQVGGFSTAKVPEPSGLAPMLMTGVVVHLRRGRRCGRMAVRHRQEAAP